MCKENIQLQILKRSEMTKKRRPTALFFIEIRTRNTLFFFYLALHVLGQLQINQTNPFVALFMYRNIWFILQINLSWSVYRPSDLLKYFKMCSGDQDDFWNTSDTIGNYPYHWATETLE